MLIGSNTVYVPDHIFKNPLVCFDKVTTPKGEYLQKLKKEKLTEIDKLKKDLEKMEGVEGE